MSKSKYKTKFLSVAALLVAATAFFVTLAAPRGASAEVKPTSELFTTEGFSVSYGAGEETFGRKGVLLSTGSDRSKATFTDLSAVFDLDFAIEGKDGAAAFGAVSFGFTDKATGKAFSLTLSSAETGNNVRVSHQGVNMRSRIDDVSFTGGKSGVIFDGRSMNLAVVTASGKTELLDFSSASDMSRFGAAYTLASFDKYDVSVSVSSIVGGEQAKICLFSLSGEPLSGETLTDAAGPLVCGAPALYTGTKGERYFVSASGLDNFDLVDGRKPFDGEIRVKNKSGVYVSLDAQNSFVPQTGSYTAEYRAKDAGGKYGETVSFGFTVSTRASSAEWDMTFPVYGGEIPAGTEVTLPAASVVSSAATDHTPALETTIEIVSPSGSVALSKYAGEPTAYTFAEAGKYTVKYSAKDYGSKTFTREYTVTAKAGSPIIREKQPAEALSGSYLYLSDATSGGKTLAAEAISPDGAKTNYRKIALDRAGVWTIRYYDGNATAFEEYVRVRLSTEAFLTTKNGVALEAGAKTPDYYDFEATGLGIAASLPTGQAFFDNAVNLGGKTKDEKLIEFLVVPEKQELNEIVNLELVIRDAHDENNYIVVAFKPNKWGYRQLTNVSVSTSDGRVCNDEALLSATLYGKFTGGKISTDPIIYDPTIAKPFSVYWDGADNSIWMSPARNGGGKMLVADLDAPETFGVGNEWKGFTSGEAEIGFVFREIKDTAHIIVTEFDGLDFGGEAVSDVTPPSVLVTGEAAVGLAGSEYNLPSAYGVDSVDGVISDAFIEVRLVEDGRKTSVPTSGKFSFVPTKEGRYEVAYYATDRAGNVGKSVIYVDVVSALDPIELTEKMSDVFASETTVGDRLLLRDIPATGGSGKLTCVKYLYSASGMTEITQKSLLLTNAGDYMLRYAVTDYLGTTENFDFYFRVKQSDGPVFGSVTVPEYAAAGKPFVVPDITATDYSDGIKPAEVKLYIDGNETSAGTTISPTGDFTLKAVATDANGRTSEKTFVIRAITVGKDTDDFIADHFVTDENVTKLVTDGGVEFTASRDASFGFVNSLPTGRFTLAFSSTEADFGSGTFALEFTDGADSSKVVKIAFRSNGGRMLYSINDGDFRQISGSFIAASGFTFGIYGNSLQDADGNIAATITETAIGEEFTGFTGGKAYVTFRFEGVNGSASITMKQLCNQVLGKVKADRIRPMIVFDEELVREAKKGDTVMMPQSIAADVLDGEVSFKLSVTAPDGSTVYEGDADKCDRFTADMYGVYYLTYTAKDSSGNSVSSYASVQVLDYEAPEIEIAGTVPASLEKGKTFVVPQASVGEGNTLIIFLVSPDGVRREVTAGETVTVERAGLYRLMFYAHNADYSSNIVVRNITVA